MQDDAKLNFNDAKRVKPLCPLFGECGGCQFQDIPYGEELARKEKQLREALIKPLVLNDNVMEPIIASPKEYHYRCRLDLKLLKTRDKQVFIGFTPATRMQVIAADSCAIALQCISDFIPAIKQQAPQILPEKYRNANLVVKGGDDNRVFWGGIGRRSLRMQEGDYLWTEVQGKRIYYSLDGFFQANLSILPVLMDKIRGLNILNDETVFYDIYGGVGLFGISFYDIVKKIVLIEENKYAIQLAQYNSTYHQCENYKIFDGKAEEYFVLNKILSEDKNVFMMNPPRAGLSDEIRNVLVDIKGGQDLLYLSCHPDSLLHDLVYLTKHNWQVKNIIPFDFFPKTKHIETLVLLGPK
ncbi:MAG: class I SAM-dependent RNA methyltransferase [Candidatus Omnitrophica bacterium]|nr:class I SAM-dependent RNA methyltransferase [Candidatus Omnitrophota bacterium]